MHDVEKRSHLILREGFECLLSFHKFLVVFPHCLYLDTASMAEMNMHHLQSKVTQLKPIKIDNHHNY